MTMTAITSRLAAEGGRHDQDGVRDRRQLLEVEVQSFEVKGQQSLLQHLQQTQADPNHDILDPRRDQVHHAERQLAGTGDDEAGREPSVERKVG